ncbi:hypothetical protein [Glaciecola sp. SC05]|uniref:hypothetical protein n=1 Tax=Glaciecola sp. SC05 TaxID=1987355 RepID=UPI003528EA61
MQEVTTKAPGKSGIVKLAIPILIAIIALLIYNFQSIDGYQKLSDDIGQSMIKDPAVSAVLLTYRDNQNIKELTINIKGATGELGAYRDDVVNFVCTSDFLSNAIKDSDSVDVKITASLRKKDKYLDISVTNSLCSERN